MKKFKDKNLLITGGTGSFGGAVLENLLNSELNEIRIFSRDEKKQNDMRNKFQDKRIKFFIGDVRDRSSVDFAMKGMHYVFHAAALKQVPSCEFYPLEAMKTNVFGAENVLSSAIENDVEKVICLSTDKAVYPINAMGITKALMEKIMIAKSRVQSKTILVGTRYGNVMASRGSVIPLFVEQMKANVPLTITDPSMTRFMMSLDEAVELVFYAFENGDNGDLFIQKSPAATIETLALSLKEIFKSETPINVIGIRHGEKPFESLLSREEISKAEDLEKYYRIPVDDQDLSYQLYFTEGGIRTKKISDYNSSNVEMLSVDQLKNSLLKLEYIRNELQR